MIRQARYKWKGVCNRCKTKYIVYEDDERPTKETCFCAGKIVWSRPEGPTHRGDAEPQVTG